MEPDTRAALAAQFPEFVSTEGDLDPDGVVVPAQQHVAFATFAKQALGYTLYVTVVATHFPAASEEEAERHEVATVLRRPGPGTATLTWRVLLEGDATIDTLYPLFAGADWQEREQYDLVGVTFADHPDMRRLMMPEDWPGHPLRKEYAIDTPHAPWR